MRLRTLFLALACSLPALGLAADEFKIFELKNGTIYTDVPIIEETDTHYTVSVPDGDAKSIKVEKQFNKSDIKQAIRPTPEEIDYKKLLRFVVPVETATEQNIVDYRYQVERFLKKYPNSEGKAAIDEQLVKYDEVLKHLEAGDVRYEGKWISKSVQERIAYTLQSKRLLDTMKSRVAMRDYRNALNVYDKLLSDFSASEATVAAEKSVLGVAALYEKQLRELISAAKDNEKKKQQEFAALGKKNPAERTQAMQAYRAMQTEQTKLHSERVKKEREAGIKRWLPINTNSINAMEAALSPVTSFIAGKKRDIENKKEPGPTEGIGDKAVADFWAAVDSNSLEVAKEKMSAIRGFRVPEPIRAPMDVAMKDLQDKKRIADAEAREAREQARKAEAEKRAADRAALREKERKARAENEKKAREAAAKRAAEKAAAKK